MRSTGDLSHVTLRLPALATILLLAACSGGDPQLMNFAASQTGPDEFLVTPAKPLVIPPNKDLVAPTPGGVNLAAPTPQQDAVLALGGTVQALDQQGIPASDQGLVSYASRLGVAPNIRTSLAEDDLRFRKANTGLLLERITNANVYYRAYAQFSLNQEEELERLRRAGLPTPSAPPIVLAE
ncbi:DUF3035 domain-containing protein [Pseudoruegeria sp. SK021]|uniref:DUF3035 domain-containing protein n=1 Tax=Pseudoruegeria sp. SK021 TaxID=1933035 RepID=UPI000A24E012|nr:DUF3035 domain-containing protein [Pseudoruegeria sp. SK021]OSP55031.1 hypothetical protein BV911_09380 [Pseudoruegeria sp. SK021]